MQDPVIQWVALKFYERPLQPNELQTARKILYGALILILFTASFFWRRNVVEAQADRLALREQSRGELEFSGSFFRLTLTGSRGLATCYLWVTAIDKQKKNQWNELEFYVNALTRLQPHFTTPWLFQSWNLSYNVAAESDRWTDKYFYITRGIQLLYRGERQNRNNPDMRFAVGFYTQHKICQSDETHVHRSLFQLSCIPLNERDPARFRTIDANGKVTINWNEFESFCHKHPQLVRRLRAAIRREGGSDDRVTQHLNNSQFRCNSVDEVINFLADNWRLPSLYQDALQTPPGQAWDPGRQDIPAHLVDRFPVLPPLRTQGTMPAHQRLYEPYPNFDELTTGGEKDDDTHLRPLDDNVDGWAVARAWFGYAQEPIPDPDLVLPGENQERVDRVTQRLPKNMVTVLFRTQPCLAQSHQAVRLMQEGWFDAEPWTIDTWFDKRPEVDNVRPPRPKLALVQGNALQSWENAYQMWEALGNVNHLRFRDAAEEVNTLARAKAYCEPRGIIAGNRPPDPPGGPKALSAEDFAGYQAASVVARQTMFARMCNYEHHLIRSKVERLPETMHARFLFRKAERETQANTAGVALQTYDNDGAVKAWIHKVLLPYPAFRNDELMQEQTVEYSLAYLDVYNEVHSKDALEMIIEFNQRNYANPLVKLVTAVGLSDKGLSNKAGRLRLFTKTPFDMSILDARGAAAVVGSGPIGLLTVVTAVETARTEPLLDPKIVRRVMEDKKLIPRQQPPAGQAAPPGPGPAPVARPSR